MLISDEEKSWLTKKYPNLKIHPDEISGIVEFTGNYNQEKDLFWVIDNNMSADSGLILSGKFKIKIREREKNDYSLSRLPAVYVEGVDSVPSRHMNKDGSACLCIPLEEEEFLLPQFSWRRFFNYLVIPFLYGQLFYDKKGCWPWTEYSHGIIGLLESYLKTDYSSKIPDFLNKLSRQYGWERAKLALLQKSDIGGHTLCFCPKMDKIRRCHPIAWKSILKLRRDIKNQDLNLDFLISPLGHRSI